MTYHLTWGQDGAEFAARRRPLELGVYLALDITLGIPAHSTADGVEADKLSGIVKEGAGIGPPLSNLRGRER